MFTKEEFVKMVLKSYPELPISHRGSGNSYYVEIIFFDLILKEEVPIRLFKLNPTSEELAKSIEEKRLLIWEPIKVVVRWGNVRYIPFSIALLIYPMFFFILYYFFSDIVISFSIGNLMICFFVLTVILFLIIVVNKIRSGSTLADAISRLVLHNDTFFKSKNLDEKE